jgi:hypothetical protein
MHRPPNSSCLERRLSLSPLSLALSAMLLGSGDEHGTAADY